MKVARIGFTWLPSRRMPEIVCFSLVGILSWPTLMQAYPLDGYDETGIRRVEGSRLAHEGLVEGGKQPAGALLSTDQVDLRLVEHPALELPDPDREFTDQVVALLGDKADRYGIAILDITNPLMPRYAEHRGSHKQNVGSVGKLLAALGLFQGLADAWPNSPAMRTQVLRDSNVVSDNFVISDHHTIRLFDVETRTLVRRPMQVGDEGSLWEYLDWMLSVSSNSAAAMVMREAMLLEQFGQEYPVSEARIRSFFTETPRPELTRIFQQTFWKSQERNGLPLEEMRQGSFFTAQGKKNVDGGGNSYATARSLMQYLLKMEQGRLVDEWSSRQIKRLLYMTERRIRYVSSPELDDAAVYFKSGSLYRCEPEEGFKCLPYQGNVINYMNSVAIIEQEIDDVKLDYMVVLISNVLRKNSAVDHQELGAAVHRLMQQRHAIRAP